MNKEGIQGVSFGMMDGIITTLAIIMGLSVTQEKGIVLIGVFVAGLADSFANAAGFHVSQETEKHHSKREVLKSTVLCFLSTLVVVVLISSPLILFSIQKAILISGFIGIMLLVFLGYFVSKINKKYNTKKLILEYVIIGVSVSLICYGLGSIINSIV